MIVQIYEIQTPQEAERCIALGVDHIGSVLLAEDGWRLPLLKDAIRLSEGAGAKNSLIPLLQDKDILYRALDYYRPHYIHLCDSLTDHLGRKTDLDGFVRFQSRLKEGFPEMGIMRTIPIPREGAAPDFPTLEIARTLEPVSDLFLIDTWVGNEPVEGFIGITGKPADWEMAKELVLQSPIPIILAGGLSPENVFGALLKVIPAGADSCTQTNRVDEGGKSIRFEKDFRKVERFVNEVRRAEKAMVLKKEKLEAKIGELQEELKEREAALPAHSIRPHQIMAIEDLEDEISLIEKELKCFKEI